jgi:hypothetical protein
MPATSFPWTGRALVLRRWCAVIAVLVTAMAGGVLTAAPVGAANWQISVSPAAGLTDGQTVTVTGSGFTEHPLTQFVVDWAIAQCDDSVLHQPLDPVLVASHCEVTSTPFRFAHPDAAGKVSVRFRVATRFTPGVGGVPVDCTRSACAMVVAQVTDAGFVGAATPISFAVIPPADAVAVNGQGTIGVDHPASFEIDGVQRSGSNRPTGAFRFRSVSRKLRFESTAIATADRLHNIARFTGTGSFNGRGNYIFDATVVDNHGSTSHPDRIALEIRDPAGTLFSTSSGLRHVRDGDIVIGP